MRGQGLHRTSSGRGGTGRQRAAQVRGRASWASVLPRPLGALVLVAAATLAGGCYDTPGSGEVGVVRNGGPFDNKNIRQVVCPGSGNTWVGWASNTHHYFDSSQQRTYKLDNSEDADSAPVTVPTKDGVRARISGTFYFKTRFDCTKEGRRLVKEFDEAFVTRPESQRPWDHWSGWLNSTVLPIIDSNMRQIMAQFECRQLVSSCTLVQNTRGKAPEVDPDKADNRSNIQIVQQRVEQGLAADLQAKLGEQYFTDIVFNLQPVELPGVQLAIDRAQSAFASVSIAAAKVEKAKQDKQANEIKQKGYNACHSCARQAELQALPDGLLSLGSGAGVLVGGGR